MIRHATSRHHPMGDSTVLWPDFLGRSTSTPWLLMPWLLALPCHHEQIAACRPRIKNHFNNWHFLSKKMITRLPMQWQMHRYHYRRSGDYPFAIHYIIMVHYSEITWQTWYLGSTAKLLLSYILLKLGINKSLEMTLHRKGCILCESTLQWH